MQQSEPGAQAKAGCFIVLDGVDASGTTTHSRRLVETLNSAGFTAYLTKEPTDSTLGNYIRTLLRGEHMPSWQTMALLFAADRMAHLENEVLPNLKKGVHVVSDRYDYSSLAYQSLTANHPEALDWIRKLNRFAKRPDLALILDVPFDVAKARLAKRGLNRDLYEEEALQKKLIDFYEHIEDCFTGDLIVHLSTDRAADEVAGDIAKQVMAFVKAK